jgi:hypothetical protein
MRHNYLVRAAVIGLALLFSATAVAGPKAPKKLDTKEKEAQTFRYKHKAGSQRAFTNGVIQELDLEVIGGDLPVPNSATRTAMSATLELATTKVLPNGDGQIVTTYKDLDIEISQGPKAIDKAKLAPMIDQLKGIKSSVLISPRGEQKDLKIEGAPGAQNMNESLRSALIGASPEFPEKGIKIGEGWEQKIPLNMAQGPISMKMDFQIKYTFLGYAKVKKARLAVFKMNIELTVKGKPASGFGGQSMELDGTGKGLGYLYFDQEEGALYKSEVEMSQVINMAVSAQGQSQKMRMSMKTEATMARKK